MSRRFRYTLILVLVGLGACLAAFTGWRYARVSAPVNGPIVLISVDALRPDHLSTYGYAARKTPAIDRLAADGVVFERAYSHAPQTLPSHASLFTGKLPFETGVRDTVGFALPEAERTLAEMLRDRGYATAGVVSSMALRKETGVDQGFALFDDGSGTEPKEAAAPDPVRAAGKSETVAENWLDAAGTDRAFLFLHLAEPGGPLAGTASQSIVPTYDDRVAAADAAVDQLVQHLEERQLYDRATIILVSDHGQGLGAHGELTHGLQLHEEALRVPLIVKTAEGRSKGLRVDALVQLVDVVPTVLDLVKAPLPGGLRGRSLVPLLNPGSSLDDEPVYSESLFGRYHFGWSDGFSIIDGRYQYISGPVPALYDLESDPSARTNLASSRTDVVAAMERLLAEFRGTDTPAPPADVDTETRQQLERLGYVGMADGTSRPDGDPTNQAAIVERYRDAIGRLAARDVDGAIASFRSLTDMLPGSADAWTRLATTASEAGRHAIALDAYASVAAIDPAHLAARIGIIESHLNLKKFDLARADAERLLVTAEGIEAATAHELLARIALARRRYEAARTAAKEAEADDPSRPVIAYVDGRIAFEQKRYAEALAAFEAAGKTLATHKSGPLADLRLYTAETLIQLDRLAEAEYLLLEELKHTPLAARPRVALTAVYNATGRTDEAAALARP